MFITRYLFLEIIENKNKKWVPDTHLVYKQWLCKCYEVYENYIEFYTMQKAHKNKKLVSQKNL